MNDWLHVFDFDYTLYQTFELINVWSPRGDALVNGEPCFQFDPRDFLSYKTAEDEFINDDSFENFAVIDWDKAIPILPTLSIFENTREKIILTARPQSIEKYIRQKIKGDFKIIGLGDGAASSKIKIIKGLSRKVIVYEDSSAVIDLCNQSGISNAEVKVASGRCSIQYNLY